MSDDHPAVTDLNTPRKIPLALPSLGAAEWEALREPIMSGWVTQGPKVAEFERRFAALHSVEHALAVTSCTAGLHLILMALGCGPGDEVIVPSFTWVATANAVLYCGATPILVDVDPLTYNIDVAAALAAVTPRTQCVIAVHLFGLCAEVAELRRALPSHVKLIEDAACAAGAWSAEGPAGSLGDAAAFSFHPRKSITTGEGGMVTTSDPELAEGIARLRNHGASSSEEQRRLGAQPHLMPDFDHLGYNYRMTDLQGALGCVQLEKLEVFIEERALAARHYKDALHDLDCLTLPSEPEEGRHSWQSFVVSLDPARSPIGRDLLMMRLQEVGIATRPGTHAVHMLGHYQDRFGHKASDLPSAQDSYERSFALPLHNRMSASDYVYVAHHLRRLLTRG